MICIVASEKDPAGSNIWRILKENFTERMGTFEGSPVFRYGEYALLRTKQDIIFADSVSGFDADAYVFASRHSSEAKKPCLTVHHTGNFDGKALYGGEPRELGPCAAAITASALRALEAHKIPGFDVSMEVTHHGPTSLKKPVLFIEVGSSEKEWNNKEACRAVAGAIMDIKPEAGRTAIGFGGGHYAPAFKPMVIGGWSIGHICPKYRLDDLDGEMFSQMVEKTSPRPKTAVLDKKGMNSAQTKKVVSLAREFSMECVLI